MTIVDNAIYKDGRRIRARTTLQGAFAECERLGGMTWVGLYRPDKAELQEVAEVSVAQNEQVRRISSWAAIIFAPQLVGSVYGMNFDRMPALHWAWGYPFALGLMLAIAVVLHVLFKRNDWL